jgi:hypothetical protein
MSEKKYAVIGSGIYSYEYGGTKIYKYICENNEIDRWQAWCDQVGAEKGTVEDMLSIGEDDDTPQTGLAEITEGIVDTSNDEEVNDLIDHMAMAGGEDIFEGLAEIEE